MQSVRAMIALRGHRPEPRAADLVVAGVLLVAVCATGVAERSPALAVAAASVCVASVAMRRPAPILACALAVIAIGVFQLYVRPGTGTALEALAIALDYYLLGRAPSGSRGNTLATVALMAVSVVVILSAPGNTDAFAAASAWTFACVLPFLAGRTIRRHSAAADTLQADAAARERAQGERAERAAHGERIRIARELHDIVAHSVSVMVIQTGRRAMSRARTPPPRTTLCAQWSGADAMR